ncbi:MarC family integral membrane protein [uncultured archaeon]|nr:MarC family integral membrane protein [uncultured archaeon]
MEFDITGIVTAFIALFIVMDPFSSTPSFLSITRNFSPEHKRKAAEVAGTVAAGVLIGFLLLGPLALSFLSIRIESFQIAGGLLMLLISISFALGIETGRMEKTPIEAVIIGVPMLSGPGVMLASILLSNTYGVLNVAIAGLLACLSSYLILLGSSQIYRVIGKSGLEILSRVMGVLLAAFAVEFIRKGLGM